MADDWMATPEYQAAALEGWASNRAVPGAERLQAAMQVIAALRSQIERLEAARAVRTPAKAEDVEVVARTLATASQSRAFLPLSDPTSTPDEEVRARQKDRDILYAAAEQVLAALDLPGREQELRDALAAYRRPGTPTYDQLLASHATLLDQQDEWAEQMKDAGAERDAVKALLDAARVDHQRAVDAFQKTLDQLLETEEKNAFLTSERDLAIAHDRQPYPTADAYEAACAALEKHRQRADAAEAERDAARRDVAYHADIAGRLEDRIVDLEHTLERAAEAMPEEVDPENELETQIRMLVATIAETRAVTAEDIARAIDADTFVASADWPRGWFASIARRHATEPATTEEPVYLLWSGKHAKWWKPAGWGYTEDRAEAGRFTRSAALAKVARSADCGHHEHVTRLVHQGST